MSFTIKIYSPFSKIKCNTDFTIKSKEILFLSARFDWLGGRFMGMLNAMYLAQKFNSTWKFTWIRRKNKLSQKIEIDHPQKYFSSEFMNENFADPKEIYTKYTIVQSRGNEIINNKKNNKITTLNELPLIPPQHNWGWFVNWVDYSISFPEIDSEYWKTLHNLWKKIDFSNEIKQIKSSVDQLDINFENYTAIHFRIGEIVYSTFNIKYEYVFKGTIPELAYSALIDIIKSGKNIIIFSDSYTEIEADIAKITNNYNQPQYGKIIFANKYRKHLNLPQILNAEDFFDLFLFSKFKNSLISTASGFSMIASIINGTKFKKINELYPKNNYFHIINEIHQQGLCDTSMKIFSACFLFINKTEFNLNETQAEEVLNEIIINDVSLSIYEIAFLQCEYYITYNKFAECENYLSKLLNNNHETISNFFKIENIISKLLFSTLKNSIKNKQINNYPLLLKLQNTITNEI